jgi:hypothetical protein
MIRTCLIVLPVLLATPALASEQCVQLARAIFTADPAFPQIVEASARELAEWPPSCAGTPPTGEGRVVQLCRAETSDQPIYFWLKQSREAQTLGYAACP